MHALLASLLIFQVAYLGSLTEYACRCIESHLIPFDLRDAFKINSTISPSLIPRQNPKSLFQSDISQRVGSIDNVMKEMLSISYRVHHEPFSVLTTSNQVTIVGMAFEETSFGFDPDYKKGRLAGSLTWPEQEPKVMIGYYKIVLHEEQNSIFPEPTSHPRFTSYLLQFIPLYAFFGTVLVLRCRVSPKAA